LQRGSYSTETDEVDQDSEHNGPGDFGRELAKSIGQVLLTWLGRQLFIIAVVPFVLFLCLLSLSFD
jgi:hypothetical protein